MGSQANELSVHFPTGCGAQEGQMVRWLRKSLFLSPSLRAELCGPGGVA